MERRAPGREEQAVHTTASEGRAGGSGCHSRFSRKRVSNRLGNAANAAQTNGGGSLTATTCTENPMW